MSSTPWLVGSSSLMSSSFRIPSLLSPIGHNTGPIPDTACRWYLVCQMIKRYLTCRYASSVVSRKAESAHKNYRPAGAGRQARIGIQGDVETVSVDVDVLLDMGAQIQRMLAHQTFGEVGVALFEGFDDVHMVDDGAANPVLVIDRLGADRPDMHE